MTPNDFGVRSSVRYQPDETPPKALSLGLGFQLAAITVAGVVLTPAIVIRAAGGSELFLSWAVFAAVVVAGVTTVVFVTLVGAIETVGDSIAIQHVSWRKPRAIALLNYRAIDAPLVEKEISLRLLRHVASSVLHQQYHDTDIVTVRVDAPKPVRGGENYQIIEEDG